MTLSLTEIAILACFLLTSLNTSTGRLSAQHQHIYTKQGGGRRRTRRPSPARPLPPEAAATAAEEKGTVGSSTAAMDAEDSALTVVGTIMATTR